MAKLKVTPQMRLRIEKEEVVEFNYRVIDNSEYPAQGGSKKITIEKIEIYYPKKAPYQNKFLGSFLYTKNTKPISKSIENLINKYFHANKIVNKKWKATNEDKSKSYKGTFTQKEYDKLFSKEVQSKNPI